MKYVISILFFFKQKYHKNYKKDAFNTEIHLPFLCKNKRNLTITPPNLLPKYLLHSDKRT